MDGGTATAASLLLLPVSEGSSTAPAAMDMDIRCIGDDDDDDAVGGSITGLMLILLLLLLLQLVARDGGSMAL